MNVLPLVFAVLALLGVMTYSRYQTFMISKLVDLEYKNFCQEVQLERGNQIQDELYQKSHREGGEKGEKPLPPSYGTRKLNLLELLEGNKSSHKKLLLEKLLTKFFGAEPFFLELEEKHPLLCEEAISALQKAYQAFPDKKKIKKVQDLTLLPFSQESHRLFWYFVLKDPENEKGDEEILDGSYETFSSLLSLATKEKNMPIRPFLASKELLKAIFLDDKVVLDLMEKRRAIYNALQKQNADQVALKQEFQNSFSPYKPSYIPDTALNWDVTKTNPN